MKRETRNQIWASFVMAAILLVTAAMLAYLSSIRQNIEKTSIIWQPEKGYMVHKHNVNYAHKMGV